MNTPRRVPELDGIRGPACIVVMLFHAFSTSPFLFLAWSLLDLFFVLSGFLMTTIILRQGDSDGFLLSFYLRRGFRIWPVYYLTLAGVLLANHFMPVCPTEGLVSHLFFLQNCQKYVGRPVPGFIIPFIPSWTVAVEMQYYLVWPLLVLMFGRRSVPYLAASLLAIIAIGRFLLPEEVPILLGTRGDGLALGCFLAWLVEDRTNPIRNRMAKRVIWIAGVAGAVYVSIYLLRFRIDPHPRWVATCFTGFSLLFFGFVGSCVIYSGSPILAPLRNPVMRWFGTISYAMYLFHMPILLYFPTIFGWTEHSVAIKLIKLLLLVGLPAASWYLLEQPILRWKESLIPLRSETETIVRVARTPPTQLP